jgi:hypothetical protein
MQDGWTRSFGGVRRWPVVALVVVLGMVVFALVEQAHAQDDSRDEFWPEVDAFVGLGDHTRMMFMASSDRSKEDDYREATVGVLVDYFAKPFARSWLKQRPDVEKQHYLTFRGGYRYSWDVDDAPGGDTENRLLLEGTGRAALRRFFLLNRSRFEWRDINDATSWRYRNRTRIEGDISMGARATTPYAMVEFFYDSRYDDWNRQRYYAGVDWHIFTKTVLDTYYCRQNDSRSSIEHVNAFGVTLKMYF